MWHQGLRRMEGIAGRLPSRSAVYVTNTHPRAHPTTLPVELVLPLLGVPSSRGKLRHDVGRPTSNDEHEGRSISIEPDTMKVGGTCVLNARVGATSRRSKALDIDEVQRVELRLSVSSRYLVSARGRYTAGVHIICTGGICAEVSSERSGVKSCAGCGLSPCGCVVHGPSKTCIVRILRWWSRSGIELSRKR